MTNYIALEEKDDRPNGRTSKFSSSINEMKDGTELTSPVQSLQHQHDRAIDIHDDSHTSTVRSNGTVSGRNKSSLAITSDRLPKIDTATDFSPPSALPRHEHDPTVTNPRNPEQDANLFQYLTYTWLSPLIDLGKRRFIEESDLFDVRDDYRAKVASRDFQRAWRAEVERARATGNVKSASLIAPFRAIYGRNYVGVFIAKVVCDGSSFVQPVLLQLLLFSLAAGRSTEFLLTCSLAMFGVGVLSTLAGSLFWRTTMVIGQQSRNCLITAIFQKSLKLSPRARQERSTGQIVNLISTDASKIDSCLGWMQTLPACLIQIVIAVALLINTIGVSSLAGVAVIVILIPIQGRIVGMLQRVRKRAVVWTDRRVKLSNEILQGIKVIKVYAWERSFLKHLTNIRLDEMALVRKAAYIRAFNATIAQFGPILMSLVAFIVLAASGGDLTPEDVFASLVLFNLLRFPLMQLPFVSGMVADALVSKKRIEEFLLAEEITDQAQYVDDSKYAVEIDNGEFSWEIVVQDKEEKDADNMKVVSTNESAGIRELKRSWLSVMTFGRLGRLHQSNESSRYRGRVSSSAGGHDRLLMQDTDSSSTPDAITVQPSINEQELKADEKPVPSALRNVNVKIPRGSLTIIVGTVGSGKSSLLSGILGEMKRKKGSVKLCGSVSYCNQSAWIQNASLKNNILFGLPYNARRYNEVLKVCELERDLSILPAGDATEIGEKGINLSGGQKQRVSIARAVYFDADILLLDDIFSALDMHVGASIFKNCILGTLKNRTRLLVTHQLQYCQFADHILFVKEGEIVEQGTFQALMNDRQEFAKLISEYGGGENEEEDGADVDLTEAIDASNSNALNDATHNAGVDDEKSLTPVKRRLSRQASISSQSSRRGSLSTEDEQLAAAKKENAKKMGELMQLEERSTGGISLDVWKYYTHSLGSNLVLMGLMAVLVVGTISKVATDVWLAYWSDDKLDQPVHFYELIYAALGLLQCFFVWLLTFLVAKLSTAGAVYLHDKSFASVSRAPTSFFDTTPIGRIVHRFSKDQDVIDTSLSDSLRAVMLLVAQIFGSLILMCVSTPLFILPLLPMAVLYYRIQTKFRKSSREIKRLDSVTRSPLFAHFSETLTGLSTIRAYHREEHFTEGNESRVDTNMRAYYLTVVMQRWLGLRLETLGSAIIFFAAATIIFTTQYGGLSPGLAGLSLSYAMTMTTSLVFMIRQSIEAEMAMNSVERSKYYAEEIDQERPTVQPKDQSLIQSNRWPSNGQVSFNRVGMRYRPKLPLILKDVSFSINGGERIGIVGRTGAGKCFAPGTLLRLYDGNLIAVENIIGGELLMGDDGEPRTVTHGSVIAGLATAAAPLYKITPQHDGHSPFIVNGAHILVLIINDKPRLHVDSARGGWKVEYFEQATDGSVQHNAPRFRRKAAAQAELARLTLLWQPIIWEVSVDDWFAAHHNVRRCAKLMQSDRLTFSQEGQMTLLTVLGKILGRRPSVDQMRWAAWYIGLWLTDDVTGSEWVAVGGSDSADPEAHHEIMVRMEEYSTLFGESCTRVLDRPSIADNDCFRIQFDTVGQRSRAEDQPSIARQILVSYGILNKKRVPHSLLTDDPSVRLCLLAGFVDGAGHFNKPSVYYELPSKNMALLDALRTIASSLGLRAGAVCAHDWTDQHTGESTHGWRFTLSGDRLWDMAIHLQVTSKRCVHPGTADYIDPNKDSRCYGFSLTVHGPGTYHGFAVHGGANRRFLLHDFTVTHNSSLMIALYRLVELESGAIAIDGENIATLGLNLLRKSLAIIPQDAVLFSGTIRSNLDPFSEHRDDQLWSVLDKARMAHAVSKLELKLESPVSEGGENFSQGERCQLCLARAMINVHYEKCKVLVLDEATASIDLETDALIQESLRKDFQCTILTIAHRLITVIDYDRIMVLSAGQIVEFDSPLNLLNKEGGAFRALVEETGESNETLLRQMAQQAHEQHSQPIANNPVNNGVTPAK